MILLANLARHEGISDAMQAFPERTLQAWQALHL